MQIHTSFFRYFGCWECYIKDYFILVKTIGCTKSPIFGKPFNWADFYPDIPRNWTMAWNILKNQGLAQGYFI